MKRNHRKVLAAAAAVVAVGLGLAGCASSDSLSGNGGDSGSGGTAITVGSANFPENVALAYVYGGALEGAGDKVSYKVNIGARAAYIKSLESGEINLVPEYAGSILSFLDKSADAKSAGDVKTALDSALPKGLTATDFSEAADSDSINVTPEFAKANNLSSIADLANVSSVTIAANPEFETRPDGLPGLKSVYGLSNLTFQAINDSGGPATLKALLDNQVQAADIYSTTPSILDSKLVTLTDPKNLFASQQVVPIGTSSKLTSTVQDTLNKVSAKLTTKDLLEFNKKISGDEKADPKTVASDWLKANGFTK
jgi:osmoprotectant transport system substrate-binding protein